MKKIISLLLMSLLILPIVLAQDLEPEIEAGTTPDSFFYMIDTLWDEVRVMVRTNQETKARIRLEIAEERLSEMQEMASKGDVKAIVKAKNEHTKQIEKAEKIQERLTEQQRNQFQQRFQKHIMTLERVRQQVPEQAKEAIGQVIDNAISHSNEVFDRTQERISEGYRWTVEAIKEKIEEGKVMIKRGK